MTVSRFYSSVAQPTSLTGNISSGATSISVNTPTGYPASTPFTVAVDFGTATEELMDVTGVSGGTWTVTRGVDGTSAQSHSIGAIVLHATSARDSSDSRNHEAASSGVHGLAGSVVGTSDSQTLANKTLTSPTVNSGALSGTFTGSPGFSGTPSLTNGAALSGTLTGTPTFSGDYVSSGNPNFTGAPTFNVSSGVLFKRPTNSNLAIRASASGDVQDRFQIQADGSMKWGPGSFTQDTNLFRNGTGLLQTNNSFTVGQNLQVNGDIAITGNLTNAANMLMASWASWTPSWSTSTGLHLPTFGNAVVAGTYTKLGRLLLFSLAVTFGSTTNFGSGATGSDNWTFTLPGGFTASSTFAGTQNSCGFGRATQNSSATAPFQVRVDSGGTNFILDTAGGPQSGTLTNAGTLDSITPWTWASGNVFSFFGFLETTT